MCNNYTLVIAILSVLVAVNKIYKYDKPNPNNSVNQKKQDDEKINVRKRSVIFKVDNVDEKSKLSGINFRFDS